MLSNEVSVKHKASSLNQNCKIKMPLASLLFRNADKSMTSIPDLKHTQFLSLVNIVECTMYLTAHKKLINSIKSEYLAGNYINKQRLFLA